MVAHLIQVRMALTAGLGGSVQELSPRPPPPSRAYSEPKAIDMTSKVVPKTEKEAASGVLREGRQKKDVHLCHIT